MILVDSNIIIYAAKDENAFLHELFLNEDLAVSIITKIEVLGYHLLKLNEKSMLEKLFKSLEVLPLGASCANKAISLRRNYNLSLGDSIIASTALEYELKLVTRNTKDFEKVKSIKLLNPFKV
jgi:predicted nucleic acid-binding protein